MKIQSVEIWQMYACLINKNNNKDNKLHKYSHVFLMCNLSSNFFTNPQMVPCNIRACNVINGFID